VKKITVRAENHNGNIRLRWSEPATDGRIPRQIALGLRWGAPGLAHAKVKALSIEEDYLRGFYDFSKYRAQTISRNSTDISAPLLFEAFTKHKLKEGIICQASADISYWAIKRALEKKLDRPVSTIDRSAAESLSDFFAETIQPNTAKGHLSLLVACWEWAKDKYPVRTDNPFIGLKNRFKALPVKKVDPFDAAEMKAIVNGFQSSKKHSQYSEFIVILFGIGCRFGEGVALRWEHIQPDFKTLWIGESITRGVRKSTKTNKARTVVLPTSIANMLATRKERQQVKPSDLVFPDVNNFEAIHIDKFRIAWEGVLKTADVEYRKPYCTRHTAISHALQNGAHPVDVATQCGHDVETLYQHYAHVIQRRQVFSEHKY
jgi:integrase